MRSKGTETWAIGGGLIGSTTAFAYIYEAEETAYQEAFVTCLREKGYTVD